MSKLRKLTQVMSDPIPPNYIKFSSLNQLKPYDRNK